jgi:hypothetical protein
MATLLDLLDRCISAGPTDGDLGATAIRVLRVVCGRHDVLQEWDDEDDDELFASCFEHEEDDLEVLDVEEDDLDDLAEEPAEPGRWVLAVGECG